MKPLGWITVVTVVIGAVGFGFLQLFVDFGVWLILATTGWGALCLFLVVWAFLDYYQPKDKKSRRVLLYQFGITLFSLYFLGVILISVIG
ncbi:hypothetical protein [Ornithinibacillus halotolerans]|uniref:Uncharacterized protein n=1 Tax=Ornithinibacillus halotolerans TaxID=1274357 RepID=A0A916RK79_9BACI|nr:hypothetical protein [Ornithinibacillus halotolerans]GGA60469.1 hypothetical protein GCM10008025_00620 [Ornithinibacillus halotolerans]